MIVTERNTGNMARKLAGITGAESVTLTEEKIVVKPGSANELAQIMKLLQGEKFAVEPSDYMIGPAKASGGSIMIALERMNGIVFDPESPGLAAGPAAPMTEIEKNAAAGGLIFQGNQCRHGKNTIGENIARCFKDGCADFMCPTACLCGLEMVLLNGEIVTASGNILKGLENYGLAYLFSGYREETAILTGVHLKITPPAVEERQLFAAYMAPEDASATLTLLEDYQGPLHKKEIFEPSRSPAAFACIKEIFPGEETYGAYLVVTLLGQQPALDRAMQEIAGQCLENKAAEILVASATSQKEKIAGLLKGR